MQCSMSIMDPTEGDLKIIWDSENEQEVAHARETFDKMVSDKKMTAFKVDKKGTKAAKMESFDKDAEAMILCPIVAGG